MSCRPSGIHTAWRGAQPSLSRSGLSAWLLLLPAHDVRAQERSRSPSPERLWKAYPLDPTVEPTEGAAGRIPCGERKPAATTRASTDGGTPVFVLALLALVAAGGMMTFTGMRRRRGQGEPAAAATPSASKPAEAKPVAAAPSRGPSGRFIRTPAAATARSTAGATATVVASQSPNGGPRDADEPPRREAPPMTPAIAPAPPGSPPDPRLVWAAEIEWRHADDESRFCVIARGAGTVEIAHSPPLDWPPEGPTALQAVTDAANDLAAMLVAAGWQPQPPGDAWYAKRFSWEPDTAKGSKAGPRMSAAKPGGPSRPETLRASAGEAPTRPAGARTPSRSSCSARSPSSG